MSKRRRGRLERLEPALSAAAITPGLRSILLFDASRPVLDMAVGMFRRTLELATSRIVVRRYLGAAQDEDDLWLRPDLRSVDGKLAVTLRAGVLTAGQDERQLAVVVIPDLAELSLASARACVALMGSDVAHLERHGTSVQWPPETCWLAACNRAAIGKISPHLLDRFALRLDGARPLSIDERIDDIRRWVLGERASDARLSKQTTKRLRAARAARPPVLPEAFNRALEIMPSQEGCGSRREIALARLAVACARLAEPGTPVGKEHVDQAAILLNLPLPATTGASADSLTRTETTSIAPTEAPLPAPSPAVFSEERQDASEPTDRPVLAADAPEPVGHAPLPEERVGPYPEDHVPGEREIAALRESPTRSRSRTVPRGSIIGVQNAQNANDLALLQTVMAAARWQPYRRLRPAGNFHGVGLRLLPSDLRSYRRAPSPEQLLVLVIDYTCLAGWDWATSLLPYLRWAYVQRAGIVLVRVGAQNSLAATRADQLATRSLLDPRLDLALSAGPGHASPLAHGLFLALQALRHGLQHGEGSVRHARLVVITDGRGNVPLELKADLNVTGIVGRAGVEDAQEVAAGIRAMRGVESTLIDPEPDFYPELVSQLAQSLGAELVKARSEKPAASGEEEAI